MGYEPLLWISEEPEGNPHTIPIRKDLLLREYPQSLEYEIGKWHLGFLFAYNNVGDFFTVSVRDLDADEDLLHGEKLMPYQDALRFLHHKGYHGIYLIPRPKSGEEIDSVDSQTLNETAELILYAPEAELKKDGSEEIQIRLDHIWAVQDDVKALVRDHLRSQSIADEMIEQTLEEHGKCKVLIERAHDPQPDRIYAAIGGSGRGNSFHIQYFTFSKDRLTETVRISAISREATELPAQFIQSFIQGVISDNHQWHYIVDNALQENGYAEVLRELGFGRRLFWRPLRKTTIWKPVPFVTYGTLTVLSILGFIVVALASWSLKISTLVSSLGLLLNTAGAIWLARPLLKKDETIEQLVDTGEAWHSRVNRRQMKSMQQDRTMGYVGIGLLIIGVALQLGTTVFVQLAIDITDFLKSIM